jgi:hypothetical protein
MMPEISYTGPGSVEFVDCTMADSCKVKMTTSGIYFFTATAPGYDGKTYSAKIAITVLDRTKLDALLQAKWEGMKTALAGGDIEGAVGYYAEGSKDNFRTNYTTLAQYLPAIAAGMGDLQLVNVANRIAECEMESVRDGVPYSFQVLFVQGANGKWSIWSF